MFFDKNQNNSVGFGEFNQALDQIKVRLSLADQHHCFNFLSGAKSYISWDDFRNLSFERRHRIGADADDESPLLKAEVPATGIKTYLQNLTNEELGSLLTSRRSTKKLEDGPVIFNKRPPIGHPRNRFSMPTELKSDASREYGRPTEQSFDNVPIKDLITNAYEKKLLLDKV